MNRTDLDVEMELELEIERAEGEGMPVRELTTAQPAPYAIYLDA